jgi:hypothetical protein
MSDTPVKHEDVCKRTEIAFVLITDGQSGKRTGKMTVGGVDFTYVLEGISRLASSQINDLLFDKVVSVGCSFCGANGYEDLDFESGREGIVLTFEDGVKTVLTIDQGNLRHL